MRTGTSLALVWLVWLVAAGDAFAQAAQPGDSADGHARSFQFGKERKATPEGIQKATKYVRSLSADPKLSSAIQIVCPPAAISFAADVKGIARNLRIDGGDEDWQKVPRAVADKEGNVDVHTRGKPSDDVPKGMDLAEVSYLYTDRDLFLRFKTYGPPAKGDVTYWFQIFAANGDPLYSVVVGAEGRWLHRYDKGKIVRTSNPTEDACAVAIKDIVEVRIACTEMPGLPDTFDVIPASYSGKSNRANYAPRFSAKSARILAETTPAYLLARYGEQVDLQAAGLLPLAMAITESFIFENVEPSLRETVVADGLAMIEAGEHLRAPLKDLPLEALLAWSNRSLTWGGLSGLYLDQRGKISREAYDFMCVNPKLLPEVRTHLQSLGIGKQRQIRAVAQAIDQWATSKNRYRWKLEVLKDWSQSLGGNWKNIYQDAARDIQAGRDKICTVNGTQIYFHTIMSPNLDWRLYRKNNFYYGACGDVAVMEMLALKSLGIPDICFFWRFGAADAQIHTFAGYYDRDVAVWRSPQQPPANMTVKGASVLQWSLPPLSTRILNYVATPVGGGAELWVTDRSPYAKLSVAEMRQKLADGFSHEHFCKLLYAQVR